MKLEDAKVAAWLVSRMEASGPVYPYLIAGEVSWSAERLGEVAKECDDLYVEEGFGGPIIWLQEDYWELHSHER